MDLSDKYLIWEVRDVPCMYVADDIKLPQSVKSYQLHKGVSLIKQWPASTPCLLTDGDPKKPVLPDSLANTRRLLIISERLKKALQDLKVRDLEFLPVKTVDSKGKAFDANYFIVNMLHLPDCLDPRASGAKMDSLNKEKIESLKQLEFKSDPKKDLFAPANYSWVNLISRGLSEKLSGEGFSGIQWLPLFDHPEFGAAQKIPAIRQKADELNKQISRAKPQEIAPLAPEKPPKLMKVPAPELKQWVKSLGAKKHLLAQGNAFLPMLGNDSWLEAYQDQSETWPSFDPKRYYCIGSNGQSDYYLLDLEDDGAVVFFTHEEGFNDHDNFSKVAPSLEKFKKMVREVK